MTLRNAWASKCVAQLYNLKMGVLLNYTAVSLCFASSYFEHFRSPLGHSSGKE